MTSTSGVLHSSRGWLWCACILACVGVGVLQTSSLRFEVRMMNAVWRTPPGTCCDHASHSRSKFQSEGWRLVNAIREKPSILRLN